MAAWFVPARVARLLHAIVAADDIAGDSTNDRAGDRSARVAMGGGVADQAAADRTHRRSRITTTLTIRRFRCDGSKAERKRSEGK